jgi:transcriptional regulator with XRE-family HTH domain
MFKINEKLKKIRCWRGISQIQIAEKLGMSVASYSRIESGKTQLNIDLLKNICKVLEIELTELLENNLQLLAEPKTRYGKKYTIKETETNKNLELIIAENNLLLKTMLNLLEQQKEINNKLLKFLEKSKK